MSEVVLPPGSISRAFVDNPLFADSEPCNVDQIIEDYKLLAQLTRDRQESNSSGSSIMSPSSSGKGNNSRSDIGDIEGDNENNNDDMKDEEEDVPLAARSKNNTASSSTVSGSKKGASKGKKKDTSTPSNSGDTSSVIGALTTGKAPKKTWQRIKASERGTIDLTEEEMVIANQTNHYYNGWFGEMKRINVKYRMTHEQMERRTRPKRIITKCQTKGLDIDINKEEGKETMVDVDESNDITEPGWIKKIMMMMANEEEQGSSNEGEKDKEAIGEEVIAKEESNVMVEELPTSRSISSKKRGKSNLTSATNNSVVGGSTSNSNNSMGGLVDVLSSSAQLSTSSSSHSSTSSYLADVTSSAMSTRPRSSTSMTSSMGDVDANVGDDNNVSNSLTTEDRANMLRLHIASLIHPLEYPSIKRYDVFALAAVPWTDSFDALGDMIGKSGRCHRRKPDNEFQYFALIEKGILPERIYGLK